MLWNDGERAVTMPSINNDDHELKPKRKRAASIGLFPFPTATITTRRNLCWKAFAMPMHAFWRRLKFSLNWQNWTKVPSTLRCALGWNLPIIGAFSSAWMKKSTRHSLPKGFICLSLKWMYIWNSDFWTVDCLGCEDDLILQLQLCSCAKWFKKIRKIRGSKSCFDFSWIFCYGYFGASLWNVSQMVVVRFTERPCLGM